MSTTDATWTFRLARAARRMLGIDRERRWNTQYAGGEWDRLHHIDELAHHAVLAGYCARLKPQGSVLDVGCGDGLFHTHLNGHYGSYLGIDFAEPVRRANHKANQQTRFLVADMHEFTTDQRFDAIVFDESLSYHQSPITGLLRYSTMLAETGLLLISMHRTPKTDLLWAACDEHFAIADAVTITNRHDVTWTTKVLIPTRTTAHA
jgi:2-polyprenyl-3-methyl-5-hydroxy-6-metoxy-1,4-benzoquinol methylase